MSNIFSEKIAEMQRARHVDPDDFKQKEPNKEEPKQGEPKVKSEAKAGQAVPVNAHVEDSRNSSNEIYEKVMGKKDSPVQEASVIDLLTELVRLISEQNKEIKKINKHVNSIVKLVKKLK